MDVYEATRVVYSRIQRLEPENASKIIGYLLLQDSADQEMIRLAFGPDALLQTLISTAKKYLGLAPTTSSGVGLFNNNSMHMNTNINMSSSNLNMNSGFKMYWPERAQPASHYQDEYLNYAGSSHTYPMSYREDNMLRDQLSFMNSRTIFPEYGYPDIGMYQQNKMPADLFSGGEGMNLNLSPLLGESSNMGSSSLKPCLYFARGYCKHGSNCRFLHGYNRHDGGGLPISPTESRNSDETSFQGGSLERLEIELQELLRGKKAPVSIASLPQLYYEKFGKTLQAEGYLTESQRHGKAGYSLTKLLARLKNTVTLIDRPHGQHAVVLAEEAHKYLSYGTGLDDTGSTNSGSRQIYLTFPAESTFTEEDVSNYFRNYGPVHDVRIPYQQKRMFGFVTFMYPETVKVILAKGNPHYVCGARVLVKPYKEKGKLAERKNSEKAEQSKHVSVTSSLDLKEYDHLHLGPRLFDNSDIIRRQFTDQEHALELERKRLSELNLIDSQKRHGHFPQDNQACFISSTKGYNSHTVLHQQFTNGLAESEEETKPSEDLSNFTPTDHFGYLLDVLENNEEEEKHQENKDTDSDSYIHNLPESPFANLTGIYSSSKEVVDNEKTKDTKTGSLVSIPFALARTSPIPTLTKERTCSMCLGAFVQSKKLECNHTFCINCETQVFKISNLTECPICLSIKGTKLLQIPENINLHDFPGKRALTTSNIVW